MSSTQQTWSKRADDGEGAQIDLLIMRRDNVANLREAKFYGADFCVDKAYDRTIGNRRAHLARGFSRKTVVHSALITTFGLHQNECSDAFDNVVTMDDLFA